jgi:pilus assembly protein CpaF
VPVNLAIELADGTVQTLTVDVNGPVSIGRDPSCHVVLPSPDVSRRHLTIEPSNGAFLVTDNSANGTMVGTQRVRGTTVQVPGNLPMRVGPYVLRILDPASPPHPSAPIASAYPATASMGYGVPPGVIPQATAYAPPVAPPPPGYAASGAISASLQPTVAPTASYYSPPVPAVGPPVAPPPGPAAGPPVAPPPVAPPPGAALGPPIPPTPAAPPPPSVSAEKKTGEASPYDVSGTSMVPVELRKRIHKMLLEHLDLASLDRNKMDERVMRPKVRAALRRITTELKNDLPPTTDVAALIDEITDEALGLGPLERLLADDTVSEIMVVDPTTIYVERKGKISRTALRFTDDEAVRAVIERIVTPLGRRIDESTPLVDARLRDGSRVNAVIRPLAIKGSCITIRKFAKTPLTLQDLIKFGAMTEQMGRFLTRCVKARKNIVISGGTGSGKTTLLNVLSAAIPEDERIVTIEDAAELQLKQPHVVSLETRPANMEGRGEYTIRDLVKNALRMRPDRIIVGECRGGEALDMLQAMNTGHEGSMTTTHANTPREAIARLETLALMSGLDLPARAIREQIASAIHLIVQQTRFSDGSRKVTSITEIVGIDEHGEVETHEIFGFYRTGTGPGGKVIGEFRASGYLPSFLEDFITQGLVTDGDYL